MIDNPADFYNIADFAVTATYNGSDLVGIFAHEYVEVGGIESRRPVFRCQTVNVGEGDSITIEGDNYTIANTEPNGHGEVLLILKNA